MYEQQFGLKKRPFLAKATGNSVFVGPQTAKTMQGLKKALIAQDAVVAVSGPAGAGKTTLVAKALAALSGTHTTVRIGRMQLEGTDVLEFLLEELGTPELPRGAIRQFTALREQLNQLETDGKRVVIVLEDAMRTGTETLAELEALTAADAGDSDGAAIVLMGDHRLLDFLKEPQLARLDQRVRQRHALEPLRAAELRGYLMHCFRLAGTDFEQVFDGRTAELVHELSGGIPRVANNLIESAISSATAAGFERIPASFVADVAKEEFGLEAPEFDSVAVATEPPIAEPLAEPDPIPELLVRPEPESEPEPEPEPALEVAVTEAPVILDPEPEGHREPVIVFSDKVTDEHGADEGDIRELIQDTLPDLEILAPEIVVAEAEPELPVLIPEPQSNPEPVLDVDPELARPPTGESSAKDVPEWERDPTMAELKPDLDALEKAMAFAHGRSTDEPEAKVAVAVEPKEPEVEAASEEIPEITLDDAIQTRIEDSLIDEPGQISASASAESAKDSSIPEVKVAPRKAKKADAELERIAAELAKAKTIDEIDDQLVETLFGAELNLVAAQVIANAPSSGEPANDDELALFDTAAARMAQAAGAPAVEVLLETPENGGEAGLDLGASQRLKTVRALNAHLHPSLRKREDTKASFTATPPPPPHESPEPIEDQINTSMTQTLKALNVQPPISERTRQDSATANDEQEPKKNGFFNRFKRS